jgi:hypothetical protein
MFAASFDDVYQIQLHNGEKNAVNLLLTANLSKWVLQMLHPLNTYNVTPYLDSRSSFYNLRLYATLWDINNCSLHSS